MPKRMPGFFSHLFLEKGWRYALNYLHLQALYNTRNPFLNGLIRTFTPFPSYFEIENTTRCNLRCVMCEHTYWNEAPRAITYDEFKKVADQFTRLKWVGLTGIGESYLNPDFEKMLRYCAERRVTVEIFDIFYFIDEKRAKTLIDLGTDQIWCSMDGATKETYEKIRVGSDFDRVMGNVKNFVRLKRARGTFFPVLDFHYIVNAANLHEMVPFIRLVAGMSPGSKIMFTRLLHSYDEIGPLYTEIPPETIAEADRAAAAEGVQIIWNMNVGRDKPPGRTCVTWYMPFIFSTGEVIPCCSTNEANRRGEQRRTSLGNVFREDMKDIWWGGAYRSFRNALNRGDTPEPCGNCCLYDHGRNGPE